MPLQLPSDRDTFKAYLLRRLGYPVVEINVTEDQIQDRIDDALQYYWDYHSSGYDKIYYKQIITQDNIDNRYIQLPPNVIGVMNIFDMGDAIGTNNMFDIRYQIALNDLYTITSVSMIPYYVTMMHLALLEELLVGKQPLRYNRHSNRCYIDMEWARVAVGGALIVEAYAIVDPDVFNDVWQDRWLLQYASELIKRQWGTNLKLFSGQPLPGGITLNGQKIFDEAEEKIRLLESYMINDYGGIIPPMVG